MMVTLPRVFKAPIETCREIRDKDTYMQSFILIGLQMLVCGLAGLSALKIWEGFVFPFLMPAIFGMTIAVMLMLCGNIFKFKAPFNKMLASVAASTIPSTCGMVVMALLGIMMGSAFAAALVLMLLFGTMIAGFCILLSLVSDECKDTQKSVLTVTMSSAAAYFVVFLISAIAIEAMISSLLGPMAFLF